LLISLSFHRRRTVRLAGGSQVSSKEAASDSREVAVMSALRMQAENWDADTATRG
jgi:hypothetical protein